ncbi:MAG: hypothetical protein KKD47_12460 [Proteobacteria bacterium]|nr:hypothetical protein [Pseudomonadota bacterium]
MQKNNKPSFQGKRESGINTSVADFYKNDKKSVIAGRKIIIVHIFRPAILNDYIIIRKDPSRKML